MRTLSLAALTLTFLVPALAVAQDRGLSASLGHYPTAYVERPLNLPAGNVRIDGRLDIARVPLDPGHDEFVGLNVGAAVGVTDNVEIGISSRRPAAVLDGLGNWGPTYYGQGGAVPLHLAPGDAEFQSIAPYARFGLAQSTEFDLSLDVGMLLPVQDYLPWVMFVGVPIRARLSQRFSIDAAAEFSAAFFDDDDGDGTDPELSMHFPIAGVINFIPQMYLAGRSGIFLPDMDFELFTIPLTFELGFTVGGDRPYFDVYGSFGFPRLFQPSADDAVVSEHWVATVGIDGFIGR